MRSSWQLLLTWGVLVGLGTGTTAMVLGATVVSRWFSSRRGAVMGVLTASTATGQMLFLASRGPCRRAARLARGDAARRAGGRAAAPAGGAAGARSALRFGLLPYGASPDTPALVPSRENPLANALRVLRESARKGDFWLLAGSFFVCGASTNGLVGTHLIPACMDHGIPRCAPRACWR